MCEHVVRIPSRDWIPSLDYQLKISIIHGLSDLAKEGRSHN